ncbi:flavin reductase family protein [Novosphingobium naphthalenivorans]|uniref:flavin reductase family protein n=1 Tax=Novosphingobium naphthalenivorans TaxID=273168 RepID=UPI00082D5F19|nr:flavin reductase family protein [Novosphingobium naphthalenivorans]
MIFDMRALGAGDRYKIIGACITPRPIAWVTSQAADGSLNLSPFSFFNALGSDPPIIALGLVAHTEKRLKDTAANIRETGEFVVNLVGESSAEAMNLTSIDAPPEIDEIALADLLMVPSIAVAPPRVAEAPASFECVVRHYLETGVNQVAILAEVLHAHVGDEFLLDRERIHIDVPAMKLVSRLHGAGWYGRQTDKFEMLRPAWSDVVAAGGAEAFAAQRTGA